MQTVFEPSGDAIVPQCNISADQSGPATPPPIDTQDFSDKSTDLVERKPRLARNWKDCKHKAADKEEHETCPKSDCSWGDASEEKQIRRHVWNNHRSWAGQTNYYPIGGTCPECDKWSAEESHRKPYDPVAAQLSLSVVAIHTTSGLLTDTMLRLIERTELVEDVHKEVVEVHNKEGWP
ncbi:hypothetical protein IWW34DRAFT_795550 [Fusarium oxysporum f. sp. albedinis]|nr:hypothetical protein IWW34DRAFT_795550 [Fusarium oxysporum f. sp. albedinis]